MIDSHTHLHACKPPDEELVAAARQVGVTKIVTVGTDARTRRAALGAAEGYALRIGVGPWEIMETLLETLREVFACA